MRTFGKYILAMLIGIAVGVTLGFGVGQIAGETVGGGVSVVSSALMTLWMLGVLRA